MHPVLVSPVCCTLFANADAHASLSQKKVIIYTFAIISSHRSEATRGEDDAGMLLLGNL